MSEQPILGVVEHTASEAWVGKTLFFGSYGSFTLLILAGVVSVMQQPVWTTRLATAGVLLMLATPALRLVATLLHFVHLKHWKLALICVALLCIITLATTLGINLH